MRLFLLFLALFVCSYCSASDLVVRVYDGDTFFITQDGKQHSVRLRQIDAPEMKSKCKKEYAMALQAKYALQYMVLGKEVTLTSVGRDFYGRILADASVDGYDVGAKLISLQVVRRYKGKRYGWC